MKLTLLAHPHGRGAAQFSPQLTQGVGANRASGQRLMRRFLFLLPILLVAGCGNTGSSGPASTASEQPHVEAAKLTDIGRDELKLPNHDRSIKFAIIGDSGRGSKEQYEVAAQMEAYRQRFDYKFVLMAGDNIYEGPATDEDYRLKFEEPYKPLLDRSEERRVG